MRDEPNIIIRCAVPSDAGKLTDLAVRTFRDTFAADNRPEDMELHIARSFNRAQQEAEINDPNTSVLFAEIDGKEVAFAQIRRSLIPPCVNGPSPVELWRFYVDHFWIGCGVAQRLMEAARTETIKLGGRTLWLGVWERNPRAIAFYHKCGFEDVGSHVFQLGNDAQIDRVMVYSLDELIIWPNKAPAAQAKQVSPR